MKHLFEEKVIIQGYLESIEGDLDWRISVSKGDIISTETLEERMKIINNHIVLLKATRSFIETLWTQNQQLRKNGQIQDKSL